MGVTFVVEELFHVGIPVINVEKSKSYFCDIFDFRVEDEFDVDVSKIYGVPNGLLHCVILKGSWGKIELLKNIHPEFTPPQAVGRVCPIFHIAMFVTDSDTIVEKVKAAGYEIWTEGIVRVPKNHQIVPGCRIVYLGGPDGIVVEILERPKK